MNYTKGEEWLARQTESGHYEIESGEISVACAYLTEIEPETNGDAKSNAFLIAAAPDMYEALKAAQLELATNRNRTQLIRSALLKTEKALAKAEGKS